MTETKFRKLFMGLPPVRPIGFGAMQLTGDRVWGPYPDRARGVELLRSLLDEGVNFIDTADVYGPHSNEELIRDALYPYEEDLIIATKGGFVRGGPDYSTLGWVGNPKYLRQSLMMSLRRLRLESMPLYYLHSGYATDAPFADQIGELEAMREEGLIQHIGLSNVTAEQFLEAREIAPISAVTALYNVGNRSGAALLRAAEEVGTVFSPWHPVSLADGGDNAATVLSVLSSIAAQHDVSAQQVALAWLLQRSATMLPIPGTTDVQHLRDNVASGKLELDREQIERITDLAPDPGILPHA